MGRRNGTLGGVAKTVHWPSPEIYRLHSSDNRIIAAGYIHTYAVILCV